MENNKVINGGIAAPQEPVQSDWVVGWEGGQDAEQAAREMARVMSRILDREVAAASWCATAARHTFVVTNADRAPAEIAARLEGKRLDAFAIRYPVKLENREVCLLVAKHEKSCDLPVYAFLTKYLGAEWVGPDPLGEVLPSLPNWEMPTVIDDFENPAYEHRFWQSQGMNARRWLGSCFHMQFHHNLRSVFDPDKYGDREELYPFYGGKRHVPRDEESKRAGWQPCTSTDESVEVAVQYGLDYLRENTDKVSFSLSVNDGGKGSCMCEACIAQDPPGALDRGQPDLTERYFKFYNAVAERITREKPDAYVAVLGYGRCKSPPKVLKIHPRIAVFNVCSNTEWEPNVAVRQEEWQAAGAIPCLYQWLWDTGFLTVRHFPHAVQDVVNLSHAMGGFGYYCEDITIWAAGGPKFYTLARLLWDTKTDVDATVDQYLRLAYGEASVPAMRTYFQRWEKIWERGGEDIRYNTGRGWRSKAHLEDLKRDDLLVMDKAIAEASAAPGTLEEKARMDYVQTYYRWLRINADQYLVTQELSDETWILARTPEEVMLEAERGIGLTSAFEAMWKEIISKDRTGWLMSVRYSPEETWDRFLRPLRREVLAGFDPSVDVAFDAITHHMLESRSKEEVATFWRDQLNSHPVLAPWIRTQMHLLETGPGENLVENAGFETGVPGPPPEIAGWEPHGAWQDVPAIHAWSPHASRNGSEAAAVGQAYTGGIRTKVPTVKGRRYRASGWYRSDWEDEKGEQRRPMWSIGGMRWPLPPTKSQWRPFYTTFTADTDGTVIDLITNGLNREEWTWFDDVEVVEICGSP